MPESTKVDRLIRRVKDTPVLAKVIFVGLALVAVGEFTEAIDGILSFVEKRVKQATTAADSGRASSLQVLHKGSEGQKKTDLEPDQSSTELLREQLRPLYFNAGSYNLSPQTEETLTRYAALLGKEEVKFVILGHSNEVEPMTNLNLSRMRAREVEQFLGWHGILAESTVGYGAERPLKPGYSPYNDRVEIRILNPWQEKKQ